MHRAPRTPQRQRTTRAPRTQSCFHAASLRLCGLYRVEVSSDLCLRSGALQVVVEVGQTRDLLNIDVVHAIEALRVAPLPHPMFRVGHRVLNLELLAARQQADALDD